jgi:hypothetical protein
VIGLTIFFLYSMVLDDEGSLYTFGSGACGALGHGDTIKQEYPLKVMDFGTFIKPSKGRILFGQSLSHRLLCVHFFQLQYIKVFVLCK